jgi:hypothetical protein
MGDFLNIIIDDLDDINGHFFYKNSKWDGNEKINSFLAEIFISCGLTNYRACTFQEAKNNPNEIYYYFILSLRRLQFVMDENNGLPLNPELLHYIKDNNKNIRVVIYNHGETDIADSLYSLNNWVQRNNINPRLFWFANNNAELLEFKEKCGTDIGVFSSREIVIKFARAFKNIPIEFNSNKKYIFTSYNGTAKIHRYALLCLMKKDGILDVTDWSLVFGDHYRQQYMFNNMTEPDYNWYLSVFDVNKILRYKDEIDYFSKIEKKLTERENELDKYYDFYDENTFKDSYVNIVTESHFIEKDVHITEKSVKPFYFYQIPIFVATKHHVKKLRERYDLDFFDDLIDHSYDNVEDNKVRLSLVYNQIHKIFQNRDSLSQFYIDNQHRFEENKRKIIEVVANDKSEFNFFNNLINDQIENFYFNVVNADDFVFNDLVMRVHEIKSHLDKAGLKNIRVVSFGDIIKNPNENYFTLFKHGSHLEDLFKHFDDKFPFSEIMIDHLKKYKNYKLMFYNDHECDNHRVVDYMNQVAINTGIDPSQIFITNNNSNLYEYKKNSDSLINVHKLNMLYKTYSWQFTHSKNNEFIPMKDFLFMCHNRRRKSHRYALICAMKKLDLLKMIDWTLLQNKSYIENNVKRSENGIDIHFYKDIFTLEDLTHYESELRFLETFDIKKSKYEQDVEIDDEATFQSILTFEINPYRYSYINIATESNYFNENNNSVHISEKSYIPFFFYQLPLFVASCGHVKKVREYGFDLFDDLIDHSYDDISNSRDRFFSIVKEIERLSKMKDAVIDFYIKNEERFKRNKQLIDDFRETWVDRDYFLNLIKQ